MTGSVFPLGERNKIIAIFLIGKIRRILQNAPGMRRAGLYGVNPANAGCCAPCL